MQYNPQGPKLSCPCGIERRIDDDLCIEDNTGDYLGAIWQMTCPCGRSWTVEVANDPDYPQA